MTQNAINVGVVAGGGNTFTFPAATDTLVGRTSTDTLTNKTLTTPVINGTITGTGQATAATASTITMRDSNANIFINNGINSATSVATAAGTTTLTISSARTYIFTGTSTQTVVLPVASTLTVGHKFTIINQSTGIVTINSSGSNVVRTLGTNQVVDLVCVSTSGTDATSWYAEKKLVVLLDSSSSANDIIKIGNSSNSSTGLLGTKNTNGVDFVISNGVSSGSLILNTNAIDRVTILSTGQAGFGQSTPTATIHLKAGTTSASSAPLKFTSGSLMTTAEAGAVEFLTDAFYGTITTGTARRMFVTTSTGRATAQTAANASVQTLTIGASDASFEVSANVLVTTSSAENFTITVAYTDEGNTSRTITMPFITLAGASVAVVNFANGAVPYAGTPVHIRVKASTTITVATTGTFTGATYNVESVIKKTS